MEIDNLFSRIPSDSFAHQKLVRMVKGVITAGEKGEPHPPKVDRFSKMETICFLACVSGEVEGAGLSLRCVQN